MVLSPIQVAMASSKSNVPATISGLPDEVLLMIFAYVGGNVDTYAEQKTEFYALSMTSRPFHRVAAEYLYKRCILQPETSRALIRTVTISPSISSMIKEVEVGCHARVSASRRSHGDLSLLIAKVTGLKLSYKDERRWIRQLSRGVESAEAGLLLLQTPNIESLVVGDQFREINRRKHEPFRKPPFWMQLIIWATDELPRSSIHSFSILSRVHINMASSRQVMLAHIFRIFRLPSMKAVILVNAVEYGWNIDEKCYMDLLKNPSPIEELYFEDCIICEPVLSAIITSCGALRCFDYDFVTDDPHAMEFPTVGRALQGHHLSLETLKLGCTYRRDNDNVYPLGSLKYFHKLTHIQADAGALIGYASQETLQIVEVLPKSIQALVISIEDVGPCQGPIFEHVLCQLKGFMQLCAERFPLLRKVNIPSRQPLCNNCTVCTAFFEAFAGVSRNVLFPSVRNQDKC